MSTTARRAEQAMRTLPAQRSAFTLVEALVAISLAAFAGAVALLSIETSLHTIEESTRRTIARGLAEQLADEAMGCRFMAPNVTPHQLPLGPNNWERQGEGRERFDDTDDFHNYSARPAVDRHGVPLGRGDGAGGYRHPAFQVRDDFFRNWRQRIEVYYVDPADPAQRLTGSQTSDYRCLEITILWEDGTGRERTLAQLRRVYAYAPPAS